MKLGRPLSRPVLKSRREIVGPSATLPREFLIDLSADREVCDLARFYHNGSAYPGPYYAALRDDPTLSFVGTLPYEEWPRDMPKQRF
ncbi:hypothetical protein [Mesorhizobium sp.]|uniref:hypothetical protein n=1 Tax=Mesorhizobium sp. TaxID=1871066 RepID=UPI000FE9D8F8|nr:hypothetical protein [Mesorhizobium sp.]RWO92528.1 MAG: hypothetical protein EOQ95_05155 [Mesorhizobium sp.]RWQ58584.1 MAG: hypothetical protein EOS84_03445 [Mesorhizobium sp.]